MTSWRAQAAAAAAIQVNVPHTYGSDGIVEVPFLITLPPPPPAAVAQPPLVFIMNGANVEGEEYQSIADKLAELGYPVVASTYRRPLPFGIPIPAAQAGCPTRSAVMPSAALIDSFMAWAAQSQDAAFHVRRGRSVAGQGRIRAL